MKTSTLLFLGICLLWGGIFFVVILVTVPQTPISPSTSIQKNLKAFSPQGWNFFTKSPREPNLLIFEKNDGTWAIHPFIPNAGGRNLLGLKRQNRALGLEYGLISENIPVSFWQNSTGQNIIDIIKSDTLKTLEIKNAESNPILCGEYVFVLLDPLPYSWSKNTDKFHMSAKLLKVNMICSEG